VFESLLLARFAPAAVVVNRRGDISFIHGRTGAFLEPSSGQPRNNVLEMAREGLRPAMVSLLRSATASSAEVSRIGVRVKTNGGFSLVDAVASRIHEPESLRGLFLVTFRISPARGSPLARRTRSAPEKPTPGRVEELEQELLFTKELLQNAVSESRAANEELRSSNEELQSTNEELQSTNEELETSKEEMQSLNEELQTVNAQLQSKVEAFSEADDDMQNLLNSTAIATVFLDDKLKIRRFTEEARKVFNLIPSDVGRPIADMVVNLHYDRLGTDATEVLRTLVSREREVQSRDDGWRQVRILPYRTTENVIAGLVVTLVDITSAKRAEQAAEKSRAYAESIVSTVPVPLLVLDPELRVVSANRAFYRHFKARAHKTEKRLVYELDNGQWNIPRLRHLLETVLPKQKSFEDFEVTHTFRGLGRRAMRLNARCLDQGSGHTGLILLAIEDVTAARGKILEVKLDHTK
jgi:two-component system CheB/CheR fusion protein